MNTDTTEEKPMLALPVMTNQILAYIDLLGFKEIIGSADSAKSQSILTLLSEIYGSRKDFSVITSKMPDIAPPIAIPAISSFSDHVVFSFNLDDPKAKNATVYQCLSVVRYAVGNFDRFARSIGCLVRGAVVTGQLYHAGGVVFGPALVEAYELERDATVGPRVIVHPNTIKRIGYPEGASGLFRDQDGFWCLDYMSAQLKDLANENTLLNEEKRRDLLKIWACNLRADVLKQAKSLEDKGALRAASKWHSYAAQFEQSMKRLDGKFFNVDGSAIQF
ncbi:MAG TPA: hypothetical protein VGM68_11230 [Rhizomicrobium sp.]|jgi:hypothetical protein